MKENNSPSSLKITTLGSFNIEWEGNALVDLVGIKPSILMLYLVAYRDEQCIRDNMASNFWNNSNQKSARYNLRHALWSIKKTLKGNSLILSKQHRIFLNPTWTITCDFQELEYCHANKDHIDIKQMEDCLRAYKGEFLTNVYLNNALEINDWILYTREYLERLYFELTEHVAMAYRTSGMVNEAIKSYRKLLSINPYYEKAYYEIMQLYVVQQAPHKVVKEYHKCCDILRTELYIEPSEDIQTLYDSIRIKNDLIATNQTSEHVIDTPIVDLHGDIIEVNIESQIEFYGLQKIISSLLTYIDKSKVNPAFWKEIASLIHIYPPLIHECGDIHVEPIEAAILYSMIALVEEYLVNGKNRIHIHDIKETDSKTEMLLKVMMDKISNDPKELIQFYV